jgi:hypothetical protein
MFISFFCLLDCANFAARMNCETKSVVFFIPFLFIGSITALMPLKWKYILVEEKNKHKVNPLEINLQGEVVQKNRFGGSKIQRTIKKPSIKKSGLKMKKKEKFYFLITYTGYTNFFIFIVLILINFAV